MNMHITMPPRAKWKFIADEVCERYSVPFDELKSGSRKQILQMPKHEFCHKAREAGYSLPQIGKIIGMDHSSVYYHFQMYRAKVLNNPDALEWRSGLAKKSARRYHVHQKEIPRKIFKAPRSDLKRHFIDLASSGTRSGFIKAVRYFYAYDARARLIHRASHITRDSLRGFGSTAHIAGRGYVSAAIVAWILHTGSIPPSPVYRVAGAPRHSLAPEDICCGGVSAAEFMTGKIVRRAA